MAGYKEKGFLDRFFAVLDRTLSIALIILVAGMVFSVTAEILLNAAVQPILSSAMERLTDERSSPGGVVAFLKRCLNVVAGASAPVNTASQTLLVWVGILGSALALRQRAHLGVDAFIRYYPYNVRVILGYVATILVGLFSLFVLVIGGYLVCHQAFTMGSKMPGIQAVNRGWFYLVLVITGALNLAYCLHQFIYPQPIETMTLSEEERGETT